MGEKLQSTIIGIFNYVVQFHKFYLTRKNIDQLKIKNASKKYYTTGEIPGAPLASLEKN